MSKDEKTLAEIRKTLPKDEFNYDQLDPGIRDLVRKLRESGFETTDSGDGVSKPAVARNFDFPHVFAVVSPNHMVRLSHMMASLLPANWLVEATYSTKDKVGLLMARPDA